jgi:hypothetical protein
MNMLMVVMVLIIILAMYNILKLIYLSVFIFVHQIYFDYYYYHIGILDLIQVFVEALDKCFENVCELDLIFHSDRVNYILDEIILAGMVLETNINQIILAVNEQNKLHTNSLNTISSSITNTTEKAKDISGRILSSLNLASK